MLWEFVQIFARPFVGAMDGHIDAISCMAKNPSYLKGVFSGSMDGGTKFAPFLSQFRIGVNLSLIPNFTIIAIVKL